MKKLLALVLTLCMALSMVPAMAETTAAVDDAAAYALVRELFKDIEASVANVNLTDVAAQSEKPDVKGSNYAVFEKVLENILKDNGEDIEEVKQALDFLSALEEEIGENAQEQAEAIFSLILLGLAAQEEEEKSAGMDSIRALDAILEAFFSTFQENEVIQQAVEATGSRLFEMVLETDAMITKAGEEGQTIGEKPFADCEPELANLRAYIENTEGLSHPRAALDMLDLFQELMDDIHESLDGHTHEETAERVNTYSLLDELITTIQDAVMNADIATIKEKTGDAFEMDGGAFGLYEKVLSLISGERTQKQEEVGQGLADMLAWLASLEEATEVTSEDAAALFTAIAQEFQSRESTREEEDHEVGLRRVAEVLKAVFETLEENQEIMDAVTASGSEAINMLTRFAEAVRKDVEESGVLNEITELSEEIFQEFESELSKVTEYLESSVGEAATKSIRFLSLVDTLVHEVHNALSGHEHAHE